MVFTKDKCNKIIYKYNKIYIYKYNKIPMVFTKDKCNKIIYKYNKIYIYVNTIRFQWCLQKINIIR